MNTQDTHCPHCGAQMKEWWHRLTPGLVNLLFDCIQIVKSKNKNLILRREIIRTPSEAGNFYKLRYFGLIAKHRDQNGDPIEGEFVLTVNAGRFLRGEIEMPIRVKTYRNQLIEKDQKTVPIRNFYGKVPEYDSRSQFDFEIHNGEVVVKKPEAKCGEMQQRLLFGVEQIKTAPVMTGATS